MFMLWYWVGNEFGEVFHFWGKNNNSRNEFEMNKYKYNINERLHCRRLLYRCIILCRSMVRVEGLKIKSIIKTIVLFCDFDSKGTPFCHKYLQKGNAWQVLG